MKMREKIAQTISTSGLVPERSPWDDLLPETRKHYRMHADAIIEALFNTDMREKISAIVYEHHEGRYHGAADAIMAAFTGETTHGKSQE
jgi:hypothetical protein